jgi:hypothetical protein
MNAYHIQMECESALFCHSERRGGGASSFGGEPYEKKKKKNMTRSMPAPRNASRSSGRLTSATSASVPAPAPAPTAVSSSSSVVETPMPVGAGAVGAGSSAMSSNAVDYTQIPSLLDRQCEALDKDNALRPTTIKTGETWRLKYQKGLLSKPNERSLRTDEQGEEKAKAFDLLDALSRSGVLSIEAASLHVVLAATHCFDKTMMDTIVQENVNPIEPVERSMLIVAGVVHGKSTHEMLQEDQVARVAEHAPLLLANQSNENENMAMESGSVE